MATHGDEVQVTLADIDRDGTAVLLGLSWLFFLLSKADFNRVQLHTQSAERLPVRPSTQCHLQTMPDSVQEQGAANGLIALLINCTVKEHW